MRPRRLVTDEGDSVIDLGIFFNSERSYSIDGMEGLLLLVSNIHFYFPSYKKMSFKNLGFSIKS